MRVVAEWCVGGLLAVAELVVTALVDVEDDGTQTHHVEMTLVVTEGLIPCGSARTPTVEFPSLQVGVEGNEAAAVGE